MASLAQTLSSGSSPASSIKVDKSAGRQVALTTSKDLAEAVTLIPFLDKATATLGRSNARNVSFITAEGQMAQVPYTRAMFSEFVKEVARRVKGLPDYVIRLTKTRRRSNQNRGFNVPNIFDDEIVNFFRVAQIGPEVGATPTVDPATGKTIPVKSSLQVKQGRLNDVLYFTQEGEGGQRNPLYKIFTQGTFISLFALHAYYAGGQRHGGHYSATQEMRQYLRQTIIRAIERDVASFSEFLPAETGRIRSLGDQLIQSIDNPTMDIDATFLITRPATGKSKPESMFNPNNFIFAHFSKLIAAAKYPKETQQQLQQQLAANSGAIEQYYGRYENFARMFRANAAQTQQDPATVAKVVLITEIFSVNSASMYKDEIKKRQEAQKKKAENAQKRSLKQQQLQMAQLQAQQQQLAQLQTQQFQGGAIPGMIQPGQFTGAIPGMAQGFPGGQFPGAVTPGGFSQLPGMPATGAVQNLPTV